MVVRLMEILGVLLGITMTLLAGGGWWALREHKSMSANLVSLAERVAIVEKRRVLPVVEQAGSMPVISQAKPVKLRAWSEDAPIAEKTAGARG